MSTQIAKANKKAVIKNSKKENTSQKKNVAAIVPVVSYAEDELKKIAVSEIDFSPFNYRKFFSQPALESFAAELAIHGIISPLTLRLMPSGRYELVAGERRLRAAAIAGLQEVPAIIKVLTDEEVTEIQLSENLQRENPHPMHEAHAIGQMQRIHKTIEEIAGRLGKSKSFVYSRIKFLDLIEQLQEMFIADAININEAFEIAGLSATSQQEFYEQACANWKEKENFKITNLHYALSRFKYDLKKAPFDTADEQLVPEMGACTNCPFNSATLKTLFPELAEQAICTKSDCYQSKCDMQFTRIVKDASQSEPVALIFDWGLPESLQQLLNTIPGAIELPRYGRNEVQIIAAPVLPDKEDYTRSLDSDNEMEDYGDEDFEDDDFDETVMEDTDEPEFDEPGYYAALQEYETDLEEYNQYIQSGELTKGLLLSASKAVVVMFNPARLRENSGSGTITAKEVQEAIKAGNATPELLQGEIDRINSREQRAKELDSEKIQLEIHAKFISNIIEDDAELTTADLAAARFIIFQSLDYSTKAKVEKMLFAHLPADSYRQRASYYDALQSLTEQQYSYLIRMAIGCKPEGKIPNGPTGYTVRMVAESAGIDIDAIEQQQQQKAENRKDKLTVRIAELEMKKAKLQCKAGLAI